MNRRPKCHVSIPMAQCDKGFEVMEDQFLWETVWRSIFYLNWEGQLEGVNECMKQYVYPDSFKYDKKTNWTIPRKLAENIQGTSLYIDNKTDIIYIAFCMRYEETEAYYLHLQSIFINNTLIETKILETYHGCQETSIIGENDGKKLSIAFVGSRIAFLKECSEIEKNGCTDIYTLYTTNSGITWTNSEPITRKDMVDLDQRFNVRFIYVQEVKRTWIFFDKNISGQSYISTWYSQKSPDSIVFNNEQLLMQGEKQDFSFAYTKIPDGKAIMHAVWTEISKSKYSIYYSQTDNNGITWQTPYLLFFNYDEIPKVKLVTDPIRNPGHIFLLFPDRDKINWQMIWSTDHGKNWTKELGLLPFSPHLDGAMCTINETIYHSLVFLLSIDKKTSEFGSFVLEENKFASLETPFKGIENKVGSWIACVSIPANDSMEVRALTLGGKDSSTLFYSSFKFSPK